MNDKQIIQLFFTRNEDAIQQTAYHYGSRLLGLAANIVRNHEDAQECVNDTYLKAQGQTAGEKSYGMVVDLAVAYVLGESAETEADG